MRRPSPTGGPRRARRLSLRQRYVAHRRRVQVAMSGRAAARADAARQRGPGRPPRHPAGRHSAAYRRERLAFAASCSRPRASRAARDLSPRKGGSAGAGARPMPDAYHPRYRAAGHGRLAGDGPPQARPVDPPHSHLRGLDRGRARARARRRRTRLHRQAHSLQGPARCGTAGFARQHQATAKRVIVVEAEPGSLAAISQAIAGEDLIVSAQAPATLLETMAIRRPIA